MANIIHNFFSIKGAGLVDVYYPGIVIGIIDLRKIDFNTAEKLYKAGFSYLELTPEGRKHYFPDEKTITVNKLKLKNKMK